MSEEMQRKINECELSIKESQRINNELNEKVGDAYDMMYGVNPYHHAKIYIIRSDNTDNVYIGSTTQSLKERLRCHIKDFKGFRNGKYQYVSSFKVMEFGDFLIELIENVCVENEKELLRIEGEYQRKNQNKVNIRIAGRTELEYRNDNKEKIKQYSDNYRLNNKPKINESNKEYRYKNKELRNENQKKYYLKNKDKINEKKKLNYEKRKNKI